MLRMPALTHVGIATLPAESTVRVVGFSPTYNLCGGRSAPKIVECLGDDGKKYKQLVKVGKEEEGERRERGEGWSERASIEGEGERGEQVGRSILID